MRLLLSRGAMVAARNTFGKTALSLTSSAAIVALLKAHGAAAE